MSFGRKAALAATVAVLFGTGLFVAFGGEDADVQISKETKTRLYVRTVPAGAEIKLDGEHRGTSNRLFVVPPGVRRMTVEVELEGNAMRGRTVEIEGGRVTRVEFDFGKPRQAAAEHKGDLDSDYVVSEKAEWTVVSSKETRALSVLTIKRFPKPYRDLIVQLPFPDAVVQAVRLGDNDRRFFRQEGSRIDLSSWQKANQTGTITVLWSFSTPSEKRGYKTPLKSIAPSQSYSLTLTLAEGSGYRHILDHEARTMPLFRGEQPGAPKMDYGSCGLGIERHDTSTDEQAVRATIAQLVKAAAEGDEAAAARSLKWPLAENVILKQLDDMREVIEAGLKPDKLERVIVAGNRALVASEPARLNDPKYKEPVRAVYSLAKQDGRWAVHDIDLEDEDGLREEIRRFKGSTSNGLIESRVLREEFSRFWADVMATRNRAGARMPKGWNRPEVLSALVEEIMTDNPTLLLVTPEEEKRFAAGEFDDAAASRRIKELTKVLEGFEAKPSWLCQWVLEQLQTVEPSGARLEVAWRLMALDVERVKRAFSGGTPAAAAVETKGAALNRADPDAARLDFRIAPTRGDDGPGTLKPEEVERYVKQIPDRDEWPKQPFAWFECDGELADGLITAKDDGRKFVLLSTEPDETMLAVEQRRKPWGLTKVTVEKDPNGQPVIGVEFDAEGARRFAALTSGHLRQPLAMLVGGKVVCAPTIQSTVSQRAIIAGQFSEQDIQRMVKSLIKGMVDGGR